VQTFGRCADQQVLLAIAGAIPSGGERGPSSGRQRGFAEAGGSRARDAGSIWSSRSARLRRQRDALLRPSGPCAAVAAHAGPPPAPPSTPARQKPRRGARGPAARIESDQRPGQPGFPRLSWAPAHPRGGPRRINPPGIGLRSHAAPTSMPSQ
jgi:hypothetical protein